MSSIGVAGVLLLSVVFSFVPWIGETSKLPSPLYMSQWGVSGSDSGRFNSPGSIAIGGDNRRYVADRGNVRVQVFDHSNTLIAVIASTAGGLAMDPDDLAVAADSTLFWLEDTGVIQRFDKNHQKINEWTATVDGGTIPGVVFERLAASKNYVFIAVRPNPSSADSNANIIRMAVDGSNIHKFTLEDPAQYQIIMNTDALATDVHDNLYVIMHYRTAPIANSITELRKFSSSGTLLKAWALTNAPHSGLAVDRSGAIYYSNAASNALIDVIAADSVETSFRFAGGVNTGGALLSPAGLAPDSLCGLFVTDGRDRVVQLRIDSDNDGLCDAWERDGIMVRGSAIPLALPAASIVRPDVYVEVDCMSGQAFHAEAKDSVVSAFNRKGITLHVDINETDLPAADWTSYADYDTFKDSYFGDSDRDILAAQKLFLRYCVFARDFHDGDAGKGEYRGNDFFIALHPLVDTLIARGGTKVYANGEANTGRRLHA